MRGYACSNCGNEPEEMLQPPTIAKRRCKICGKPLVVKMNDRKTEVAAYFDLPLKGKMPKRKPDGG